MKDSFSEYIQHGCFRTWHDLLVDVSQGSILGQLLFNISLRDLFYILDKTKVLNYADDTTPFAVESSLEQVDILHTVATVIFE